MDLSPLVPAARQIVERYGPSGFRVSGVIWNCPVLVFPDLTREWNITDAARIDWVSLLPVVEHGGVQILLLGLGNPMVPVAAGLRAALREAGTALEPMSTGAACRTYNVLAGEDRRVAAALLPAGG
ncbi:MAG TPA: Mth938-like domain-containing protein [Stellaceae bacterium]|nr:Mth938-like domain-containing protein [Stellaceae bacterium]